MCYTRLNINQALNYCWTNDLSWYEIFDELAFSKNRTSLHHILPLSSCPLGSLSVSVSVCTRQLIAITDSSCSNCEHHFKNKNKPKNICMHLICILRCLVSPYIDSSAHVPLFIFREEADFNRFLWRTVLTTNFVFSDPPPPLPKSFSLFQRTCSTHTEFLLETELQSYR